MNIQHIATQVIKLKNHAEQADRDYTAKRDEMYNALLNVQGNIFIHAGYKFSRTSASTIVSVNKESVINALQAENLPEDVLNRIISAALVQSERWGGLRILQTGA